MSAKLSRLFCRYVCRLFVMLTLFIWLSVVSANLSCSYLLPNTEFSDISFMFNSDDGLNVDDRDCQGNNFSMNDNENISDDVIFTEVPIFKSIEGRIGHHCATITSFDDGELLACWYSYAGPGELDDSAIYLSRKFSGEENWSEPILIAKHSEKDGNPVLYSEGDKVWLFQAVTPFGWDSTRIILRISEDRGYTWSDDISVSGVYGLNVKYPPIRLSSGKLLLGAYDEVGDRSVFLVSSDGTKWKFLSSICSNPGNIQPSIVQLSDNRILSIMRNVGKGWLWVSESANEGASWSEPIDSGFPNPASAAQLYRLSNGHLILIYNDSNEKRSPLTVALSVDEGKTWPYKKNLVEGDGEFSYPCCTQSSDNLIHILYTYKRDSIHEITISEQWITSDCLAQRWAGD